MPPQPVIVRAVLAHALRTAGACIVMDETKPYTELLAEVRALRARNEHLEQALRAHNEELVRFTYTISHDLKSPLVTIRTFIGYLSQDLASGDAARLETDLEHIRRAAKKMTAMLDELLELSRASRKVNTPETIPLKTLVREALDIVAGKIAERRVSVTLTDADVLLHGDRPRLVTVFQNLLDNAAKFMGQQASPHIEIDANEVGAETVLAVHDNGMGIDPAHLPRLFGLFEKLHPGIEGSGLGLALARRIVEVHGGRIWAESAGPGQGATFRIALPRAPLPGETPA